MPVEYGEFKGHKMIILKKDENDKYPFQFGVGKAKLIMQYVDAIEAFVNENEVDKNE
jgi:uncharacterized protein YgiM (DUF1202 family)